MEILTEDQAEEMLDALTRTKMGISIAEFRRRSARGDYSGIDLDSVPGLVDVAIAAGINPLAESTPRQQLHRRADRLSCSSAHRELSRPSPLSSPGDAPASRPA